MRMSEIVYFVSRQGRAAKKSRNHRLCFCWLVTLTLFWQAALVPIVQATSPTPRPISSENDEKNSGKATKSAAAQINSVTTVSAATYEAAAIAPDSIVAAFGSKLAVRIAIASTVPLPVTLGGTTVKVRDINGVERLAQMFFVSPNQINYLIPSDTAPGAATVIVQAEDGVVSQGNIEIAAIAPAIFTANQDGRGVPAANVLRVKAAGQQIYELPYQTDPVTGRNQTRPIDLGPEGERVFLILYPTGVRRAADPNNDGNVNESVRVVIGSRVIAPDYAGRNPDFAGLDQINVEIPRSLIGRGRVNLTVIGNGISASNVCEIEIAGAQGTAPPQITALSTTGDLPGQELTINGSGFSPNAAENVVRVGGVEAAVTAASFAQLKALLPFGVERGTVSVRTPQGETVSANPISIRTSISGFVENTTRQPLSGARVRVTGTALTATTDAEGLFILPDAPTGQIFLEVDANNPPGAGQYPTLTLGLNVARDRDNQFPQPISLQQIGNASITFDSAGFVVNTATPNVENAVVQTGNVSFAVPVGARVAFPDGSTSGTLRLTTIANALVPVRFPAGQSSATLAQITPFGTTLDVGGKLAFPNADSLAAGAQAKLFRLDQRAGSATLGSFIEAGFATVSADGQRIETPDASITETGIYFVSGARQTTTVVGRVVESGGSVPVRRVLVRARGQEALTDGDGGFVLRNVAAKSGDRINIEVAYARPKRRVERTQRDNVAIIVNNITPVAPDIPLPRETDNRPPIIIAPTSFRATAGVQTDIEFQAYDLEANQTIQVSVAGATFASIINRGNNAYAVRLSNASTVGEYTLTLTAIDNLNASARQTVALSVLPPPPSITGVSPTIARIGEPVTLTGISLKDGNANPQVGFPGAGGRRIAAMVTSATTTEVKAVVPNGADSGTIELMNNLGRAVSSTFSVRPSQDFSLSASPSSATAAQGSTATFVVTAIGAEIDPATQKAKPFTQLVNLEVTGTPGGTKASFNPENITGEATSTLSLVLPGNIAPGSYSLTIKGKARVDGKDLERTAAASLTVLITGQTTLSGRVLSTKNEPIMGATISLDGKSTTTDASGAFLLNGITAGVDRPLMVDGRTASAPNRTYPVITESATVIAGQANVIPNIYHLPPIDVQNDLAVMPGKDTMATTPRLTGYQMMIPAGANLRTLDGTPVTRMSITPMMIDRIPAPLPATGVSAILLTAQPGGAVSDMPMPVTYPNMTHGDPGTRAELYSFDHKTVRWVVYGYGRVSADGRTIEPEIDPATGKQYGLRDFAWHGWLVAAKPPDPLPCESCPCSITNAPVDLATGNKIETMTDVSFGGARGGLELTRSYTTTLALSNNIYRFGRSMKDNFDIRLVGTFQNGGAGRLVMPRELNGRLFSFTPGVGTGGELGFTSTETVGRLGDVLIKKLDGSYEYRAKRGDLMRFDSTGRLTALADRNGNTTTLTYGNGNQLASVTDAVGRTIRFEYNGNKISRAIDPLERAWNYTYDNLERLVSVTDPLENATRYEYDILGRLSSLTDRRNTKVKQLSYDDGGRVIRQVFADGGIESYAYTISGMVITSATVTDPLGRKRSLRMNAAGYVIEQVDELGQKSEIERDMMTNLPLVLKGPCGCAEDTREFDERGNAKKITDRDGNTTFYEYEPIFNNLVKMTDRRGNATTYTYDTHGNRLTMTNARTETTTYTYDQFGQLKTITNDLGHTMRMEYDTRGHVIERYDGVNNLTKMEYDLIGRLTAIVDPLTRRTEMTYDALDRLKTIKDANQAVTTYEYDPNGNQIAMINAIPQTWTSSYDVKNRLVLRTDPLMRASQMRYNTADEMIAMLSPSGRTTTYSYDARGQRSEMRDPLGNSFRFTYDNQRNLTALSDQRGSTTTFIYDNLYRVIARRDPLGFTTSYEYDPEGNVITTTDRLGRRTTVNYDKINRREQMTYVDAVVSYTYDRAGRLTNIADTQGGPIAWAYDEANRLMSETTPQGVVSYSYNIASQRATMTAAPSPPLTGRPPVTYEYDPAGRLWKIKQSAETFTYTYDKLSRMMRLDRPNNVKTEYQYDELNRLKRLTHTNAAGFALEDFQYGYNADDEIDAIQSLASATLPPTAKSVSEANAANRIAQFGPAGLSFDSEGQTKTRTEADGTDVYEWDARGRLKQVTLPGGQTVSYGYDVLGRRINRGASGVMTNFVYDGADVVLDRIGSSTVDYLNGAGIDNKLRRTDASFGALYFLRDHLGSTAALVSGAGSVIERTQYEAFGATAGSSLARYGFTAREVDLATKLMYYRARWYDPQQGRFITEDPIGLTGGLNFYTYVGNKPINYTDPSGLISCGVECGLVALDICTIAILLGPEASFICGVVSVFICEWKCSPPEPTPPQSPPPPSACPSQPKPNQRRPPKRCQPPPTGGWTPPADCYRDPLHDLLNQYDNWRRSQ